MTDLVERLRSIDISWSDSGELAAQAADRIEQDEVLMQECLYDICGAKLCEFNSMSGRGEMIRLMDKAIDALRERLK